MKSFRLLLLAFCWLITAVPAFAQDVTYGELSAGRLERTELALAPAQGLQELVDAIHGGTGISSQDGMVYRLRVEPEVLLVPLAVPEEPETHIFLYFLSETREYFFLQIKSGLFDEPEARIWGEGTAELRFTRDTVALEPRRSERAARIAEALDGSDALFAHSTEALSISEAIDCLARTIGVSLNPARFRDMLTSAACSSANVLAVALTGLSCVPPPDILACTAGVAQLILCGFANCGSSTPDGCVNTISLGQRVSGSWASSCRSNSRRNAYARYYTFTLSSTTAVQIDLESRQADTYLLLLRGGANGAVLARDDDGGEGLNSRLVGSLSAGTYTVEATTFREGVTGAFSLRVARR